VSARELSSIDYAAMIGGVLPVAGFSGLSAAHYSVAVSVLRALSTTQVL